jgi:hypothetical protein
MSCSVGFTAELTTSDACLVGVLLAVSPDLGASRVTNMQGVFALDDCRAGGATVQVCRHADVARGAIAAKGCLLLSRQGWGAGLWAGPGWSIDPQRVPPVGRCSSGVLQGTVKLQSGQRECVLCS